MPEGKIKWFDNNKGFGFIIQDDSEGDLFVHFNDLECFPNLEPGERVSFKMGKNDKGPCAINVQLLDK